MTCKYWAALVRPVIFAKVVLKSREDVLTFTSFVRSGAFQPNIGEIVRTLELRWKSVHEVSYPWLHHICNLLISGSLPSLCALDLEIWGYKPVSLVNGYHPGRLRSLHSLCLPRGIPYPSTIRLHSLGLQGLQFRSCRDLLSGLNHIYCENLYCSELSWADDYVPLVITVFPEPRQSPPFRPDSKSMMSKLVSVTSSLAIWPFVWTLITTRMRKSRVVQHPLYVDPLQIGILMEILRGFGDLCSCARCSPSNPAWRRFSVSDTRRAVLRVHPGQHIARSCTPSRRPVSVTADTSTACIGVSTPGAHILALHIDALGRAIRISLSLNLDAYRPYIPTTTSPLVDTLAHLDRHAARLGAAVRLVVGIDSADEGPPLVDLLRSVRAQTPRMAEGNRLAFRYRAREHGARMFVDDWAEEEEGYWVDVLPGSIADLAVREGRAVP